MHENSAIAGSSGLALHSNPPPIGVVGGASVIGRAEDKYVGGHVGFGFPLVTKDGSNVSRLADNFYMGLPIAITVSGPGRLYFDLEFVPVVVDKPREIQLVVNPGFLWRLGHGFSAGSRVAFLVNSDQQKNAQFGITPLVVKSWPIEHSFFKGYFVEGDLSFASTGR